MRTHLKGQRWFDGPPKGGIGDPNYFGGRPHHFLECIGVEPAKTTHGAWNASSKWGPCCGCLVVAAFLGASFIIFPPDEPEGPSKVRDIVRWYRDHRWTPLTQLEEPKGEPISAEMAKDLERWGFASKQATVRFLKP